MADDPTFASVSVRLHTKEVPKAQDETVEVWIEHGNNPFFPGYGKFGENEKWPEGDERLVRISIFPGVFKSNAGNMRIRVRKTPAGSASGTDWTASLSVQGHFSDGTTAVLLPDTGTVLFGSGERAEHTWPFRLQPGTPIG